MKILFHALPAIAAMGLFACLGGGSETEYLTLRGSAELPSGGPAVGARVFVRPSEYLQGDPAPNKGSIRDTVLDGSGSFRIPGLLQGDFVVEIRLGDSLGVLFRTALRPGSEPLLSGALAPVGNLRASIAGPDSGIVYTLRVRGLERAAIADAQGNFNVSLPAGEFALRVSAALSEGQILDFTRVFLRAGGDTALAPIPAANLRGSAPVPILFDCNIGFAPDDPGGLAVLHRLATLGEANILAAGTSEPSRMSAAALDAINTYFGRPGIRVGAWKGEAPAAKSLYDSLIAAEYPQDLPVWDSLPEAAALYRAVLAEQPDGKAVLVVSGGVHNAWALLRLDRDLVARKVKEMVVVGGQYPSGKEHNFSIKVAGDTVPEMVPEVIRDWPTPIIFLGWESALDVNTGSCLAGAAATNPVKRVYELVLGGPGRTNGSWDLASALYAVRGISTAWGKVSQGSNRVAADGSNQWLQTPDSDDAYLVRRATPAVLAAEIDSLLCRDPVP